MASRYRWRVARIGIPDRVGRWRGTRLAAMEAAVAAGVAKRYPDGTFYLDVLTRIETDAPQP